MSVPSQISRNLPIEDLPSFISVQELHEYLGISKSLTYRLLSGHVIPSVKIGRRLFVPRAQLIAFVHASLEGDDV